MNFKLNLTARDNIDYGTPDATYDVHFAHGTHIIESDEDHADMKDVIPKIAKQSRKPLLLGSIWKPQASSFSSRMG